MLFKCSRSLMFAMLTITSALLPALAWASGGGNGEMTIAHLTDHPLATICLGVFILTYVAVLAEEVTHMRKSKPVMLGAGIIWVLIALMVEQRGLPQDELHNAVSHGLNEYAGLMLFLLVAMTFINVLQERHVFKALRAKLLRMGLSKRALFWVTGWLAFFISPFADNMTTALVMGTVVIAVGGQDSRFISMGCISIVCAANAGGAFSPFGDITTLMVWQAGHIPFFDFFRLFVPAVVNFIVPAMIMSLFIGNERPEPSGDVVRMKPGAWLVIFLGLWTIAMAVMFEQILGLPAFLGMMTGMSILMLKSWHMQRYRNDREFNIINQVANAEWDTLLFFFGIIFCVGGLAYIGFLDFVSHWLYKDMGASTTNILIGFASAVIDNIPIMFAVLSMNPQMDEFQWLLVTLTAGVGGSLLSVGSAAGVALMGIGRGHYTFFSHLKWTPVLVLGYAASICVHFLINAP